MKLLLVTALALALSGCTALSSVTDPDGNPVTPGPVCVDTANGRVCYYPTPVPGTAAIAPAPVILPQLAK